MESKWFIILFMLASFLYRIYKKNKENKEDLPVNDSQNQSDNSWGFEDLISQFEQKYGVEEVPVQEQFETSSYQDDSYDMSSYDEEIPVEKPEELLDQNYSSETANHHAFKVEEEEEFEHNNYASTLDEDISEKGIPNLEQMIISQTILERPDFN